MHEPLWCITNTSTLGCSGHLWIRLPGDCLGPPWPPQLHRSRTATASILTPMRKPMIQLLTCMRCRRSALYIRSGCREWLTVGASAASSWTRLRQTWKSRRRILTADFPAFRETSGLLPDWSHPEVPRSLPTTARTLANWSATGNLSTTNWHRRRQLPKRLTRTDWQTGGPTGWRENPCRTLEAVSFRADREIYTERTNCDYSGKRKRLKTITKLTSFR